MGCDIHAVVQYSDRAHSYWLELGQFNLNRQYDLFSALAGVRGSLEPLYPQRGLPEGYTDYDGSLGDHSFSWLTHNELSSVFRYYNMWNGAQEISNPIGHRFIAMHKAMEYLDSVGYDVRLVFGFDS